MIKIKVYLVTKVRLLGETAKLLAHKMGKKST